MDAGIILVNYKTAQLCIDCLHSLAPERNQCSFQVVVVDNDSRDDSVGIIRAEVEKEYWQDWVTVKQSGKNGGFSFGNNIGIRHFLSLNDTPRYLHLLNSDTVVYPGAIKELTDFLDNHPKAGIAGSRLEDSDGGLQHASFQFHSILTELDGGFSLGLISKLLRPWVKGYGSHPDTATLTDWVSGASIMIRREVFTDVGLMDESYFLYYEETDFCLQAKRAGWECWHVPSSRIIHFEGATTGVSQSARQNKRRPKYWFDSRRRYFLKNHGALYAAFADLVWLIGFGTWRLRNLIQRKADTHPQHFWRDSLMNSVFVRGFSVLPVQNR